MKNKFLKLPFAVLSCSSAAVGLACLTACNQSSDEIFAQTNNFDFTFTPDTKKQLLPLEQDLYVETYFSKPKLFAQDYCVVSATTFKALRDEILAIDKNAKVSFSVKVANLKITKTSISDKIYYVFNGKIETTFKYDYTYKSEDAKQTSIHEVKQISKTETFKNTQVLMEYVKVGDKKQWAVKLLTNDIIDGWEWLTVTKTSSQETIVWIDGQQTQATSNITNPEYYSKAKKDSAQSKPAMVSHYASEVSVGE